MDLIKPTNYDIKYKLKFLKSKQSTFCTLLSVYRIFRDLTNLLYSNRKKTYCVQSHLDYQTFKYLSCYRSQGVRTKIVFYTLEIHPLSK